MNDKIKTYLFMAVSIGILFLWNNLSFAGTGGTEFSDAVDLLMEWSEGGLGKLIALGTFVVGMAIGIVRQSLMAAAVGIGMGLAVKTGPTVIDSIVETLI